MDIVVLLNGRFIEITEVNSIFLNGQSNMSPTLEEILESISAEYVDQVRDGNYMKALKRMFSILKLKNEEKKKQDILLDYFNSPNGLIYRCKNDLETMYLVLDSPKFDLKEVRNSLQVLKETISAFPVDISLEQISKLKTKQAMKPLLRKQIRLLKAYINEQAKQFIQQNGI